MGVTSCSLCLLLCVLCEIFIQDVMYISQREHQVFCTKDRTFVSKCIDYLHYAPSKAIKNANE